MEKQAHRNLAALDEDEMDNEMAEFAKNSSKKVLSLLRKKIIDGSRFFR